MAIKAGLVGVNPKGVDKNGMPISSGGGSGDAYTKAETNALLAGKVSNSQLTANNKAFHFAYDATSEKYGYKLDGTGDFIPFESAGAGSPGWNKPANLVTTGLTVNQFIEITEGGYYDDGTTVYVDIVVKQIQGGTGRVQQLPTARGSCLFLSFKGDVLNDIKDMYAFDGVHTGAYLISTNDTDGMYINLGSNQGIGNYLHIFGEYIKTT